MKTILFLCTANSARSILAEAILNARGGTRFAALSAGSHPRGEPNPVALRLLAEKGHDISGLRSKSWNELAGPDASPVHAVITVCDNAKGESCPIWPRLPGGSHPVQAHWGIPDPAGASKDGHHEDGKLEHFETAYRRLDARIDRLLALDEDALSPQEWRDALMRIGCEGEGAT